MNGVNYYKNPIFLLYWIVLKKQITLEEWIEMTKDDMYDKDGPIPKIIQFIKQYKT